MPLVSALLLSTTLGVSPALRVVDLPPLPVVDFPSEDLPAIDAASWMV